MNLLSSSWTKLKKFTQYLMVHTSINPLPETAHLSMNFLKEDQLIGQKNI